MEAHSCQHCSDVIIDLPNYSMHYDSFSSSTLLFDVDTLKNAVQNGCKFFQWALEADAELLALDSGEAYLDDLIAQLPAVYESDGAEDAESSATEDTQDDGADGQDEWVGHKAEGSCDEAKESDSNFEHSSALEDSLPGGSIPGKKEVSELELDSGIPPAEAEAHLQLYLECGRIPRTSGRCRLRVRMTRSDKRSAEPHYAYSWKDPELEIVSPTGMCPDGHH